MKKLINILLASSMLVLSSCASYITSRPHEVIKMEDYDTFEVVSEIENGYMLKIINGPYEGMEIECICSHCDLEIGDQNLMLREFIEDINYGEETVIH